LQGKGVPSPLRQLLGFFEALAYGHCGKKFAAKVPGEGLHTPAGGAVTITFV